MSKVITLRLTNKQVESWIVGNNSDDGLLDDQEAIFSPLTKVVNEEDGSVYYERPIVTFGTPFSHIDEYGNSIWVVEVTIAPIE